MVKLQRPPPDIRIFLPTLFAVSSTSTRRPRLAAVKAHIRPAAPAPRTMTSLSGRSILSGTALFVFLAAATGTGIISACYAGAGGDDLTVQ
ncbi:MAG: hypothetical protein ACJ0Q6_03160 [Candidatus Azotimanducaceae bacterium]